MPSYNDQTAADRHNIDQMAILCGKLPSSIPLDKLNVVSVDLHDRAILPISVVSVQNSVLIALPAMHEP